MNKWINYHTKYTDYFKIFTLFFSPFTHWTKVCFLQWLLELTLYPSYYNLILINWIPNNYWMKCLVLVSRFVVSCHLIMLNITLITNRTLLGDCTVVCQLNLLMYVTKKKINYLIFWNRELCKSIKLVKTFDHHSLESRDFQCASLDVVCWNSRSLTRFPPSSHLWWGWIKLEMWGWWNEHMPHLHVDVDLFCSIS